MNKPSFFHRADWIAFGLTFLIALTVYTLTLQPTVGLEDSGELIVASDYLGVPHPPGYPIWTLLTWGFQWLFHKVTYHGYPNPAWAVNFFSAFSGAAACAVLAMLVSRSGTDILRSLKKVSVTLGDHTERVFCCVAGISSGLLLAFSQGMWSQSVIAEVYSLNIFFQTLMLLFLYRWMVEPENPRPLWAMAFVYGLGMTNHQTILFMGLAVALCIGLRHIRLFRDFAIVGVFYAIMIALNKFGPVEMHWVQGPAKPAFWFWTLYALVIPVLGLFLPNGRTVCVTYLLMFLGLSFYLYMPFASDQNPPINWGYPRTWQGFMHAITRGQYEKVTLANVFSIRFVHQIGAYFRDLRGQFFGPVALLALIPFGFIPFFGAKSLLRYRGRISRLTYFSWSGTWGLLLTVISFSLYPDGTFLSLLKFIFASAATIYLLSFPIIQRLHDVGLSGAFYWIMYIPGVNVLLRLYLLFKKGSDGVNKYGGDPLENRDDLPDKNRGWIFTTLLAFVGVGILFIVLQNPKIDIQTLFIARVQYIQSHAIYAIWIGFGLLLLMALLETWVKNNPFTKWIGTLLVFLLPFSLVAKNYYSEKQRQVVGGSEQNGHGFGWEFGNWQLRGAEGIKEDLWYYCEQDQETFDEEWANYPNPEYPPAMGTNAIFFGGTDPGRFVPTYMIYCPRVRDDVYLITQNALADNTFMAVTRDLYGDQIWIPSTLDSNRAFQEYVSAVRSGKTKAGADLTTDGGRVQVQGVAGVMQINGILCKQIFDHNQVVTELKTDQSTRPSGFAVVPADPLRADGRLRLRDFYVEESYAIPWMYPYMTPHGLIMKLNNKPTPITDEMVKNDREFWDWNVARLVEDDKFLRDIVARKTFSKLRSALAALYDARRKPAESEYAFKQAIELYPLSPEANFRLANLYLRIRRFDDAREVISAFAAQDVNNGSAKNFLKQIKKAQEMTVRREELEKQLSKGGAGADVNKAFELIQVYNGLQERAKMQQLVANMLRSKLPPRIEQQLAMMLLQMRQPGLAEPVMAKYLSAKPADLKGWIELAAMRVSLGRSAPAIEALQQAISKGGTLIQKVVRKDQRFRSLWNDPKFQQLVPPAKGLPFGVAPKKPMGRFGGLSF